MCVLSEKKGGRKIPLIIKSNEAQKIALELEGIKSSRPLTHDTIKSICDSFQIDVQEIYIHALLEGVFYTKIVVSNGLDEYEIESTVGDALALSVMYKCPIYTNGDILDAVGIIINDDGTPGEQQIDDELNDDEDEDLFDDYIDDGRKERVVSVDDLEKLMQNAIENEEYEIAAEIRDRINKIKREDN